MLFTAFLLLLTYQNPSFANLSEWFYGVHKTDHYYWVNWKSNVSLKKEELARRDKSFTNDGSQYFNEVLEKNWDDLSPHYNSHFANPPGVLLSPIKNNTHPTFPLTTAEKKLHTAFKVLHGDINKFIKENILENVSSVDSPTEVRNAYMYKVTLSKAIPFYDCIKNKSVLRWKSNDRETYDSETEIGKINNNGYVMGNKYVDHRVTCDEIGTTKDVVITVNKDGQVTSIYPLA